MTLEDFINLNMLPSSGGDDESVFDPTYGGALSPVIGGGDESVFDPTYGGTLPNIDTSKLSGVFKSLFGDGKGGIDLRKLGVLGGGVAGILGSTTPSSSSSGYQGGIPKYTATRSMVTAPPAGRRPGAGGTRYGGDVTFTPQGSSPIGGGLNSLIGRGLVGGTVPVDANGKPDPEVGGSWGSDRTGMPVFTPDPQQLIKDVQAINTPRAALREYDTPENMQRRERYAEGGMAEGRYLRGGTDGMADKIPARIGKEQPAALSHGEFVIPADVVSHLGNGNSDAGAKKLYSMMDKIRKARTGNKKQGKKINPDKFMPGGLAYAAGGEIKKFSGQTPSLVTADKNASQGITGAESNLSNWAGEYVTDMLGKGKALSEMPYQEYGGPLTAGASNLQQQAFGTAANLAVPASVGTAAQTAGDIASKAQGISYSPSGAPQYDKLAAQNVSSTFQAPSAYQGATFGNQFKAPEQSAATNFTNQFQAPGQYQNTAFTSGTFGGEQAQQYMNPYLQASLNPQLEEARRQSQITEQANKAAMTRAGAFGGGRGAILAAENQRNLGTNLANITGKGYDTAFQNAMSQFNADQARNMQAQQASEQSKQFGAGQSMTAAQMMAQYGMSAQQAQEAARQFNQQQAMTGAQSAAQYGLAGRQAEEASRQFGASQGLQAATTAGAQNLQAALANQQAGLTAGQGNISAALDAARQQEQSRQFGANLGLQGLQTGLQAAKAQGDLGISSGQLGLANLQQQAALGAQQRGIEAEGIAADKAAFEEARANPYKMVQFQQSLLSGLPLAAQSYQMSQPSNLTKFASGATTLNTLLKNLGFPV